MADSLNRKKLYYLRGEGNTMFEITDTSLGSGAFFVSPRNLAGYKPKDCATEVPLGDIKKQIKRLKKELKMLERFETLQK